MCINVCINVYWQQFANKHKKLTVAFLKDNDYSDFIKGGQGQ